MRGAAEPQLLFIDSAQLMYTLLRVAYMNTYAGFALQFAGNVFTVPRRAGRWSRPRRYKAIVAPIVTFVIRFVQPTRN